MEILHHISLRPYNTFGVDAIAGSFVQVDSTDDLQEMHAAGIFRDHSGPGLLILGGGSNMLFTRDFPGLVVKIALRGLAVSGCDDDHCLLEAGAGENWDSLVEFAVDRGLGGLENLSGIPGCAGAAPVQNIGAYGSEIRDTFSSLKTFSLSSGETETMTSAQCRFDYRDSIFKQELKGKCIITSISFRLSKKPLPNLSYRALKDKLSGVGAGDLNLRMIRDAVLQIRGSKLPDPALLGNAGSFFKNPVVNSDKLRELRDEFPGIVHYTASAGGHKLAAGWLIEQCGWKGFREGDAGVHKDQALVLVNYGKAAGSQIMDIASRIRESVMEKFGVSLEPEVQIV